MMDKRHHWLLLLAGLLIAADAWGQALTPVKVQLKWYHQYQFAGFYAAQSQGYFEQEGLAVELLEGGPKIDPVQSVLSGSAEFGVGNSALVLDYLQGRPVVMVAAFFQHSPFIILARDEPGLNAVLDLEGRRLMSEPHSAELLVYLVLAGVDVAKVKMLPHTGDVADLLPGREPEIDASTAYVSTEPLQAVRAGLSYKVFSPRDLDIDFYGDSLFTTRAYADAHPEIVKAMRTALIRGWRYARAHPEQVINDILAHYSPRKDRLALTFEAHSLSPLLDDEVVELGYVNKRRLERIASLFQRAGLSSASRPLLDLMFQPAEPTPRWLFGVIAGLALVAALAITLAWRFRRLNRLRLKEIERRKQLEQALMEQARTDDLTELANRRHFHEVAEREFERAKRHQRPLGLMMIDVDNFKAINDSYGHGVGDQCLRAVAKACEQCTRLGDLAARIGGDEFVMLLPDANLAAVTAISERISQYLARDDQPVALTVSIGVGWLQPADESVAALLQRADQDMYQCKSGKA